MKCFTVLLCDHHLKAMKTHHIHVQCCSHLGCYFSGSPSKTPGFITYATYRVMQSHPYAILLWELKIDLLRKQVYPTTKTRGSPQACYP